MRCQGAQTAIWPKQKTSVNCRGCRKRRRMSATNQASSSSLFSDSEDDSDEDVKERRAAAAVSQEDPEMLAMLLEIRPPRSNNSAARNRPAQAASLDYTEVLNLFNKLHMCGVQQRAPLEFSPALITSILLTVKPVFCSDASCLQLSSPVVLFGDIHGEFQELAKLTDILGRPPGRSYLYLGDYVDRGPNSLEVLLYLMLMKILHPNSTFVLRGNHEDRRVYRHFNFENDLMRLYGTSQGQTLSALFATVLAYLPLCAIINREVFCCHGGLSPHFNHNRFANCQKGLVDRINTLSKPVLFRRHDYVADLLWSDPLDLVDYQMPNLRTLARSVDEWCDQRSKVVDAQVGKAGSGGSYSRARSQTGRVSAPPSAANSENSKEPLATVVDWLPNPRGISYVYSRSALAEFMRRYSISWVVRGHMFVSNGFKESLGGRCITLFSAADYAQKYRNPAAILAIEGLTGSGRQFPGRVVRYTKSSLMNFGGTLPTETNLWPKELNTKMRFN